MAGDAASRVEDHLAVADIRRALGDRLEPRLLPRRAGQEPEDPRAEDDEGSENKDDPLHAQPRHEKGGPPARLQCLKRRPRTRSTLLEPVGLVASAAILRDLAERGLEGREIVD